MRLLPKKKNTQKNLHTENIAHDPLPSSAKPESSIHQTFFGRQTIALPKKFFFSTVLVGAFFAKGETV